VVSLSENILQYPAPPLFARGSESEASDPQSSQVYVNINPLLICNRHFALLYLTRLATWKMERDIAYIFYALHIYNMMSKTGHFPYWHDAEFIMHRFGNRAVFIQDTRPNSWGEALFCLKFVPWLSKHSNFLEPSPLMKAVYEVSEKQSVDSAAKLSTFLRASMQRGNQSSPAEELQTLGIMAMREHFEWHFSYFAFRLTKCMPLVRVAVNSLFLHLADQQSWSPRSLQEILETLILRLSVRGPNSSYTLQHLRSELGQRIRVGSGNSFQQMEVDAKMSYPRQ
jgi:hypothetical protein